MRSAGRSQNAPGTDNLSRASDRARLAGDDHRGAICGMDDQCLRDFSPYHDALQSVVKGERETMLRVAKGHCLT